MWAIASSPARSALRSAWLVFAVVNTTLMFLLPGEETIPYHLVWASFALLYGLLILSRLTTWLVFSAITIATGIPLIRHARSGIIGWEECSEIVLMGVIVALLIWHVNRHRAAQDRLETLREQERVRAQNREVTTRFGSHQVRTRLTIARGFADLIRDTSPDEITRNDAALIVAELDKASALTGQLLTLVRVDAPSGLEVIDVDELIDTVVRRWKAAVDRDWSHRSSVGFILGDAERLEAAMDCLIENATKFTCSADSISVLAYTQDGELCIDVHDSGSGIPSEDLHRITGVFEVGSTAGERAGSGLGLAIVAAIVNARDGRLTVASEVGTGTTVGIRVPARRPQPLVRTNPMAPHHDGNNPARSPSPADPVSITEPAG